jgi:hypothetical protein
MCSVKTLLDKYARFIRLDEAHQKLLHAHVHGFVEDSKKQQLQQRTPTSSPSAR